MAKQDVRRLDKRYQIVFVEGNRPSLVKKVQYFTDKKLKQRIQSPAPVPKLEYRTRGNPAVSQQEPIVPVPPLRTPSPIPNTPTKQAAVSQKQSDLLAILEEEAADNETFQKETAEWRKVIEDTDVDQLVSDVL